MKPNKYDIEVTLLCPECGSSSFQYDSETKDPTSIIKCASCGRECSREQLIQDNKSQMEKLASQAGEEAVKDFAKEMRKSLEKAFRGNKNIKLR